MRQVDNRSYYDAFAARYEDRRHAGYHALIDDLSFSLVEPFARGREVLEIGCGTGLILERLAGVASRARGIDLSDGMLERARARGLDVRQGDATELPFEDASFDLVVSFKVLAHVEDVTTALREAARVTRPGGRLFLEFYNRRSLRYLIRRLRPPGRIAQGLNENAVFVRFDDVEDLNALLPQEVSLERIHGTRVLTVVPQTLSLPVVGGPLRALETWASRSPLGRFGGFVVLECAKREERNRDAPPGTDPRPR